MMKKSLKYYIVIWIVLVGLFNIICFVPPENIGGANRYSGTFWVGYVFVMLAYLLHLFFACVTLKETNAARRILNTPLMVISSVELLLMVLFGILCMVVFKTPTWISTIVCYFILALSLILFVSSNAVGEKSDEANIALNRKTVEFRELVNNAQHLVSITQTDEGKRLSQKVYEAIRYSDMVTSDATKNDEAVIKEKLSILIMDINRLDAETLQAKVDELLSLIEVRNNKCSASKRRV